MKQCHCGNSIIAEGEIITCDECGLTWWLSPTDKRTEDATRWLKS